MMNRHIEAVKNYLITNRQALLDKGIAMVQADYSGSGDEGYVNTIMAFGPAKDGRFVDQLPTKVIPQDLHSLLSRLDPEDGYENGTGGGGSFSCHVEDARIRHESYNYVEETVDNEAEEF